MTFADTNWLAAMFFSLQGDLRKRNEVVQRFLRKHTGQMIVSEIVMLEAENVFRRNTGEADPAELVELKQDKRFYRDPLNWTATKREALEIFTRYSHKTTVGTFDATLLASAKLSGATLLLTFDSTLKALAVAEGLSVFPELDGKERRILAGLR